MKTKEEKWKDVAMLAGFLTTVIPKAETAASSLREEEYEEKLPPLNRTGTKNNIRSYWFDLTLTRPLVLEQSAYFIITQLLGTASWRITSASGSVFRHTLSAAELRLVVDVRLDRGWRERSQTRKSEGDGDRWRETQTADRKAVIKSPCFFPSNN